MKQAEIERASETLEEAGFIVIDPKQLETVKEKLFEKLRGVKTLRAVVGDIVKVFENCVRY